MPETRVLYLSLSSNITVNYDFDLNLPHAQFSYSVIVVLTIHEWMILVGSRTINNKLKPENLAFLPAYFVREFFPHEK